jgi:hypothetical protein
MQSAPDRHFSGGKCPLSIERERVGVRATLWILAFARMTNWTKNKAPSPNRKKGPLSVMS